MFQLGLFSRVFRRVLPLPNGNWNALVDDWCCHPDPFANLKLLPRPEDCLLGDSYFLLPSDSGCKDTLTQEVQELTDREEGDTQETKVTDGEVIGAKGIGPGDWRKLVLDLFEKLDQGLYCRGKRSHRHPKLLPPSSLP